MNIEVGDILIINVKNDERLGEHRDTKYAVVVVPVNESNTFNFFCINTEDRAMYDCIPIKKENYIFLRNDIHYISCSNMFKAKVEQVESKKNVKLTQDDKNALLSKVKDSKKLMPKHKKEIFSAFGTDFSIS